MERPRYQRGRARQEIEGKEMIRAAVTPAPSVAPDEVRGAGLARTAADVQSLTSAAEGLIGGGLSLSGVARLLTVRRRTRSSR